MQTIHFEKEKRQPKYVEAGKCGYCGEEIVSLDTKQRYCDDECQDEAMECGGECQVCEALTQNGQPYCSQKCENEKREDTELNKLNNWFANVEDNTGVLISWEDNNQLRITLYDTSNKNTAAKHGEALHLVSRAFNMQKADGKD